MLPLRLVFFGTAELACHSLAALAKEPAFSILGVVTQPDRPKGRDLKLQPGPVKELALRLGLSVWQPERARSEALIQTLAQLQPELITVAAYGQILPPAILELPRFGCLNVHASLLPKYRGAAPIQWAILNGETVTGVTIMKIDATLDTGDVVAQQPAAIGLTDNAQTLHDRLAALGAELLVKTIPDYVAGKIKPQKQPAEGASYARKLTKEDGRLDWSRPATELWNRVRALTPWPGAFTFLPAQPGPVLLKVWQAAPAPGAPAQPGTVLEAGKHGLLVACGQDALRITELQRQGGKRLRAADFLSGFPLRAGQSLG
jgi:methionyl-tRNA formyltransferase